MIRVALLTYLALSLPGLTNPGGSILRFASDSQIAGTAIDASADQTASKQMDVARWYIGKRNYTAALNRLKTVVTKFSASGYVEEALAHLAEAYLGLGIASEAMTAVAVLGRKYPNGHWSAEAHEALASAGLEAAEDSNSWISRAFR